LLHNIRKCAVLRPGALSVGRPDRSGSCVRVLVRRALFRAHRRWVGDRL